MLAFLFQLKTYSALQARLAAVLVLALLASGVVGAHVGPTEAMMASNTLRAADVRWQSVASMPAVVVGRNGSRSRCDAASRRGSAYGRPHDHSVANAAHQGVQAPDGELAPPTFHRPIARRDTSGEIAGSDDDESEPSALGYQTRAPPIPAHVA